MPFASLGDLMKLTQDLVQHTPKVLLEKCRQAASPLRSSLDLVHSSPPCIQCQARITIPKRAFFRHSTPTSFPDSSEAETVTLCA